MGADREDRGAHLRRVLVQELVCGYDRNSELPRLRKHRLDAAMECHKVLDLVAIDGEEGSLLPCEERVLEHGENQATEGECLLPQSTFVEIHDDPVALIHRFAE